MNKMSISSLTDFLDHSIYLYDTRRVIYVATKHA